MVHFTEYFVKPTEDFRSVDFLFGGDKMTAKGGNAMKCTVIIGSHQWEEVIVYARERTRLVDEIEQLATETPDTIYGFADGQVSVLEQKDIYRFLTENNHIYAETEEGRFFIKARLYQLEECLGPDFIKINQSCIVNIRKIKRFDVSVAGVLKVIFQNGAEDYVSRRNIKNMKERFGL